MIENFCDPCQKVRELNMLELFSGIGGMHLAFQASGATHLYSKVNTTAIDINTNANLVYRFNFPDNQLSARNITGLRCNEISEKPINLVTMSPPCQPFTRLGLKKDLDDLRSDAFHHLMTKIWPEWDKKPEMVLLENVKGFEVSKAHQLLIDVLTNIGYETREFLLTPSQFGVPNSRSRYYLLAKLPRPDLPSPIGSRFIIPDRNAIYTDLNDLKWAQSCPNCHNFLLDDLKSLINSEPKTIEQFLGPELIGQYNLQSRELLVPQNIIDKYLAAMDIVDVRSDKSCCFTRSYGTLITGSGSLLNMSSISSTKASISSCDSSLRYFSPKEVSKLLCFPEHFTFPASLSSKQCYKLLGNSINIKVVTLLFKILLAEPSP